MKTKNRAKSVVEYYVLCNRLKDTIRTGWKNWNVKRSRVESVAEHVFGVQSLAIAMWSQYEYDLDFKKVIFMLAIHELEETIIGDITIWEISEIDKMQKGHIAAEKILKDFLKKDQIEQLIYEFDARQTKEAIFAFYCDKLECDIQSKLYDEEGCVDITNQQHNPNFKQKEIQDSLKKNASNSSHPWSSMWMQVGRDKYHYDPYFKEVSEYVENNKIGI